MGVVGMAMMLLLCEGGSSDTGDIGAITVVMALVCTTVVVVVLVEGMGAQCS